MRIKSFCHDIVFFQNGVFGRWKLLDMNKNVEENSWIIRSFALKNDCGMPKILFLVKWGNFWQDFWQDLGKGILGEGGGKRGGISVAKNDLGSAKNRVWDAKNLVFGRMGKFLAGFLAIWGSFWQITVVRIAGGL